MAEPVQRNHAAGAARLSSAAPAHSYTVDVTDVQGLSRGMVALVDREAMSIQRVSLNTLVVTRGLKAPEPLPMQPVLASSLGPV